MIGYEGMCMSRGNFSKPGQVTEKIIESIFVQPLRMTQTQKIITHMVLTFWNFTNGYWGMCMIGEKFLKEWQMTDKVIESFFLQFIFLFYKWLKLKK